MNAPAQPRVEWNGNNRTFKVSLPDKQGNVIEATWKQSAISVIRIREADSDGEEFSFGIEIPFGNIQLTDLKPNTAYICHVTYKNENGTEGPPATLPFNTDSEGNLCVS